MHLNYILTADGLRLAQGVIPQGPGGLYNYAAQYFICADGTEIDGEDCYILPSNPDEMHGRLVVLANDRETAVGQLGDLVDEPAVQAVLARYK